MHQLFQCSEMITYALQYLPGDKVLYLYDNMPKFRRAIRISDHLMDAKLMILKTDNLDACPAHQFIFCIPFKDMYNVSNKRAYRLILDEQKISSVIEICAILVNLRIQWLITKPSKLGGITEIDPCYHLNYDTVGTELSKCKSIFTDRLSYNHMDTDCSLHLKDAQNMTIKDTKINHLILENCENITICSKVRGHVRLIESSSINITQLYIDTLNIKRPKCALKNVPACRFKNIDTLIMNDYDYPFLHDYKYRKINNLVIYPTRYDDEFVLKKCDHIHNLHIMKTVSHDHEYFINIRHCHNLKKIKIDLNIEDIKYIIKNCPVLEKLEIKGYYYRYNKYCGIAKCPNLIMS